LNTRNNPLHPGLPLRREEQGACCAGPTKERAAPRAPRAGRIGLAVLTCAAVLASVPAHATLGDAESSVDADRAEARATVRRVGHAAFHVHELAAASGVTVREYVSPAGIVFAVSWNGPSKPNLRQLLGSNFDVLKASQHRRSGGRGFEAITEGSLVYESSGRMRSFHGRAILTDNVPSGVSTNDIE